MRAPLCIISACYAQEIAIFSAHRGHKEYVREADER